MDNTLIAGCRKRDGLNARVGASLPNWTRAAANDALTPADSGFRSAQGAGRARHDDSAHADVGRSAGSAAACAAGSMRSNSAHAEDDGAAGSSAAGERAAGATRESPHTATLPAQAHGARVKGLVCGGWWGGAALVRARRELHARIGRVTPNPLLAALRAAQHCAAGADGGAAAHRTEAACAATVWSGDASPLHVTGAADPLHVTGAAHLSHVTGAAHPLHATGAAHLSHATRSAPPAQRAGATGRGGRAQRNTFALLALLLAALWPHWQWMLQRMTDGSDEPWGVLALATVVGLVVRERHSLTLPGRAALVVSGVLAVAAAIATLLVPPLLAAALAMLALAVFINGARPTAAGGHAPLVTLLLLALPIIASLQFYLGYPLRYATAHVAAPLLYVLGFDVVAAGAAFLWQGKTVLVDPPCAGIAMLWVGAYTAALLSYLERAGAARTLANGLFAAAIVFVANVVRNGLLFVTESGAVTAPSWAHAAIGLVAFALALFPIYAFSTRRLAWSRA
jgi:exosortase/archaeosortase family protein